MAKITVYVLATCIPDDSEPCLPQVFGTRAAADAAFTEAMRGEWEYNGTYDDETGDKLPCPDDPQEAHDLMKEAASGEWGQWELTTHEIEIG